MTLRRPALFCECEKLRWAGSQEREKRDGMEFKDSFFEDEVRDGFYVPAMVKRGWAAELEVLEEIDRVCRKYDIPYFAEYGSMLGAVRHKGFIPWDDDLDIGMKRADYKRFVEVAPKEFAGRFHLFTYNTHKDFWHFLARVVGNTRICFEEEHLERFHQFPYIAGVDIFVLDNVCKDSERQKERNVAAKYVIEAADLICETELSVGEIEAHLARIEKLCNTQIADDMKFYRHTNLRPAVEEQKYRLRTFLYGLAEELFASFENEECEELARMMPDELYGNGKRVLKKYYEDFIRVPFENTTIPVPVAYDEMLRARYGDYMKIVKNCAGHDYPFFASQQKELDEVLQKAGEKGLKGYEFELDCFERQEAERKEIKQNSAKSLVKECISQIEKMQGDCICFITENKQTETMDMLANIQQLFIELGSLLEQYRGEGLSTVRYIEEYCELIFHIYKSVSNGRFDSSMSKQINTAFSSFNQSLKNEILEKQEVVFIVSQYSKWKYVSKLYQYFKEQSECDVHVIPVPYYYKKYDGSFYKMEYEVQIFCEHIPVENYDSYDFGLNCPEKIIIQSPFDSFNSTISVHPFFYSENLKKYTDELVYIPDFEVDDFDENYYCEYVNMQYYCLMPGVVNADKVLLSSKQLRDVYIKKLQEFAGEKSKVFWETKIQILGEDIYSQLELIQIEKRNTDICGKTNEKKVVLYFIGISNWIQYGSKMLDKIEKTLNIFESYKDRIYVLWKIHPMTDEIIRKCAESCYKDYLKIKEGFVNRGIGELVEEEEEEELVARCDIYYGDTDSLVRRFNRAKKPVMIENINI